MKHQKMQDSSFMELRLQFVEATARRLGATTNEQFMGGGSSAGSGHRELTKTCESLRREHAKT